MLGLPQPRSESTPTTAETPTPTEIKDEELPIFTLEDNFTGWTDILSLFYRKMNLFFKPVTFTALQWTGILPIAHKYLMTSIEQTGIENLEKADASMDSIELLILAQQIGSDRLYAKATQRLANGPRLTIEQAQQVDGDEGKGFKVPHQSTAGMNPVSTTDLHDPEVEMLAEGPMLTEEEDHLIGFEEFYKVKVQLTLFKVHRYFLAKASPVLRDMLELPQPKREDTLGSALLHTGIADVPLFNLDESVAGWEYILALFYRDELFEHVEYTPVQWAEILPITNKYQMTQIEQKGLQVLRQSSAKLKPIDLLLLAKRISDTILYDQAITILAREPMLTGEQARQIGFEEFYKVAVKKYIQQLRQNSPWSGAFLIADERERDLLGSVSPDPISDQDDAMAIVAPHGRFYFETGDIVFQVQATVFKVHRHFMAKISSAFQDMLDLPQPRKETLDASGPSTPDTEHSETPHFVLGDESATGWEHILSIFYRDTEWADILPIAHKYLMSSIEQKGIQFLKETKEGLDSVELLILAKEIQSTELYERAFREIVAKPMIIKGEDARRIGFKDFYDIIVERDMQRYMRQTNVHKPYMHHSVERTLFTVHRHFLATYSPVLRDMLDMPQPKPNATSAVVAAFTGVDENSELTLFVLDSEPALGWEYILGLFYREDLFKPISYDWRKWIWILPIAHKYLMSSIEEQGLQYILKNLDLREVYPFDLLKLVKEIDSTELYERAIQVFVASPILTAKQVREIGFKAFYEITVRKELKNNPSMERKFLRW
ncbi:hypothetical protein FRC17_009563 [Serendipita sp. 399]|nr:hypothetical protein FRC17_009563 [Serendipita sp. 399]